MKDRGKYLMSKTGFYTLGKHHGRDCFIDSQGNPFFSIGLNHTDETNLLYPYNIGIWKKKYGSHGRWLKDGVAADLKKYHFNTVGWVQDSVVTHSHPVHLGCTHSWGWSYEDYVICGMPYCVNLEVAKIAAWDNDAIYPDVFSPEFEQWCDYLARFICARHCSNPNLIGYFFTDIPAWTEHPLGMRFPQLKGLTTGTAEYDEMLERIAERYYSVMTSRIRFYDYSHLILGDRFNGNSPDSDVVYKVAAKYCDVISIQYFVHGTESYCRMEEYFDRIHGLTGKPLLLADIGNKCPTELNPDNPFGYPPLENQAARAREYIASISPLVKKDYFVGWHWCAYVENPHRGWAIKSHLDEPYWDFVNPVSEFNASVLEQFR